ncbi:MAG: hypothetical protein EBQ51_06030 [Verrucomicrobia bacterium]|nr:hypothetical protein [Pseudomonadota bacterium]NBS05951.1 hypothetical protein [Verrucomicrobiota bacterium]NBS78396.1 hypothetical protein [bacterium]NBS49579.1 hypothetical protein [Verrucomicrobiota bacterium]NBT23115.1 hypothetical protein [bacterium]
MAKAKKSRLRPSKPIPHLAPEILEQAAQGWLQSHGISSPSPTQEAATSFEHLADSVSQVLRGLRQELNDLRDRLTRLESKKP